MEILRNWLFIIAIIILFMLLSGCAYSPYKDQYIQWGPLVDPTPLTYSDMPDMVNYCAVYG